MMFVGMDLHKNETQLCVIDGDTGEVVLEKRIESSRQSFRDFFASYKGAQVLMEASTSSRWAAPCLREIDGIEEVIVADPNDASMYGKQGRSRQKTDKRDAYALALACQQRRFTKSHEASEDAQLARFEVNSRGGLVKQRTALINEVKALIQASGLRIHVPGAKSAFVTSFAKTKGISESMRRRVQPLMAVMSAVQVGIDTFDAQIETRAKNSPEAQRAMSVPGFGALSAVALVAQFDDVGRFANSKKAAAYLGVVPKAHGSGEKDGSMGHITKAGDKYVRALLIQCSMSLMRSKTKDGAALRHWALRLQKKKGMRLASVALARRLTRIAYACIKTGKDFEELKTASKRRTQTQPT